jgi:hypothetical protein
LFKNESCLDALKLKQRTMLSYSTLHGVAAECGFSTKEALNNAILAFSEHAKQKVSFLFGFIFNDLQSLKMAAHPCPAESLNKSEFP